MSEQKPAKKTALDVLFPQKKVKLPHNRSVVMRPIRIKELPELMNSFVVVLTLKSQGLTPMQMLAVGMDSIIELIDHCLVDGSMDDMQVADAPFLLDTFLDQNLTETVMGKWQALVSRVGVMFPSLKEAMPHQSESQESSQKASTSL